jgi:uncharacterized protein (DUF433 family)
MPGFEEMSDTFNTERSVEGIRAFVSLREAALLADIPEKAVRKDIEARVLEPLRLAAADDRPCFRWPDIFLFAAVYRNHTLTRELRKLVFSRLETLVTPNYRADASCPYHHSYRPSLSVFRCDRMKIDDYLFIDFDKAVGDLAPRVDLYAAGLSRIEEKERVLGGEAIFKGTRLPVRHVGKMFESGEPLVNILEDYPYLSENDVKFAQLYYEAHPIVGRPRHDAETDDARDLT